MERTRVLLADGSGSLLAEMARQLGSREDMEIAGCVSDGAEVMDAVAKHAPDVLVTELILPRCDGFMVLDQLRKLPADSRPSAIVLSALAQDGHIAHALQLGAAYYMVKPFDPRLLGDRIREIAEGYHSTTLLPGGPVVSGPGPEEQITNLFLTLGIPANIKGYQYLREAVRMVLGDSTLTGRITKELYPGVARRFNTTASKVERAMRHAIEVAWNRGRMDVVNKMYGHRIFDRQDKPTNGEFISCIAEKIGSRSA